MASAPSSASTSRSVAPNARTENWRGSPTPVKAIVSRRRLTLDDAAGEPTIGASTASCHAGHAADPVDPALGTDRPVAGVDRATKVPDPVRLSMSPAASSSA